MQRMLTFDYVPAETILSPFGAGPEERVAIRPLAEMLGLLFPRKGGYFRRRGSGVLSISLVPQEPFGPDPRVALRFLFPLFSDFQKAVAETQDAFDLKKVVVIGLNPARESDRSPDRQGKRTVYRRRHPRRAGGGIQISLLDFYKLHRAAIEGVIDAMQLLSIFTPPARVASFYVPRGTLLRDAISADPTVRQYLEKHRGAELEHPITGRTFDLESDTVQDGADALIFSDCGFALGPRRSFLRAFPYFNRPLGMRPTRAIPGRRTPCNNCLRCARVCPAGLYPSYLHHNLVGGNSDAAEALHLDACIRCGKCALVCPASLPLHQTLVGALDRMSEESE